MSNVLHGPYVKGASTASGPYTGGGPYSSGNANNAETQSGVALHSFNPYLVSAGYVHSGAVCTKDGTNANQLDIASGEAFLIQTDGTLALCDIAADNTHTTTGNPSTTMYLDLNPDGSWSWGTSHSVQANYLPICQVTTDASANIATVTDKRPLSTTFLSPAQGLHVGQSGAAGSGVTQAFLRLGGAVGSYLNDSYIGTYADIAGGGGGAFLYLVLAADRGVVFTQQGIGGGNLFTVGLTPTSGTKSWIDQAGALHATAPVTLVSGNQETGFAGLEGTANAGNNLSVGVNFKTVTTNTPSSLTLTTSFSGNTTSQTATGMTKYGFWLSIKATATGDTYWAGTYTTVGNCLLAVDTAAQTFDHHCDQCGALHQGVALDELVMAVGPTPARSSLSYTCPECGASEHFNCALSAEDENDESPQGAGAYATTRGAQAALIRSLMAALQMAVA